ncbi:helix-turn-helix domain-containing protein [Stappia sp. F7233]|uniref:Helix-turn-helix domain-containing protein n=2 Tax=Stappia albiluteola TaxID=2758565 RepID=A0A839AAI6_9HYPH|nr:helix-turn-helix domain-containing protein [Stappia albiluteola]MBA5776135.1 helix-turn-helix domain-containing protein [Stappia albiluteola]MBA5777103.1 helix-turn-helix domain-containing protein [Stappia albiluteola]MBA5777435.1 helix-turn-helix domain-containing protein [Stappia albiluteola]MBA5777474.1 helix-turn-helix domain-containing protein [Stappia albiluteola]
MENRKPKWDRHSILAEFRRRGVRMSDFAAEHGRNPKSFGTIWTKYNRINEKLIADFLGDPVEVVFPDRYPIRATRIFDSRRDDKKSSEKAAATRDRVAA